MIIKTTWPATEWKLEDSAEAVALTTSAVKVAVDRKTGAITYTDSSGKVLLHDDSKTMTPVTVNGEQTYRAEDYMTLGGYGSTEAIYGLGQHQAGVWNYRGDSVDLSQDNTAIAVPLMVSSNGYGLYWNNMSRSRFNNRFVQATYFSSEVADTIDYYFLYGPEFDKVVAGYRELTGAAPMFGKWAYGFWQCKNRYQSQEELLGVAQKYRDLKIPIDNLVQDWFWWNRKGEHVFNPKYPDPKAMIDKLHSENFHLMISVWPFFEPGSTAYDTMDKNGWFVDRTVVAKPPYHKDKMAVYDASNPDARKYYWQLMNDGLFKLGIDAWWLDTTEPETEGREENIQLNHKLAIGSGNRYVNIFPLMTTTAVYEGQRAASEQKRVFILSRSAFAGSQRNAVYCVVGRYQLRLDHLPAPDSRRPELRGVRTSLLDHRHRRIHQRQSRRSCLSRALHSLVPVRYVQPDLPRARHSHHRPERAVVLRSRRAEDSHQLRPPALSPDALHLLDGVEGHQRKLHTDARRWPWISAAILAPSMSATSSCSGPRFW